MQSCDSGTRESLEAKLSFLRIAIKCAAGSPNYLALRGHYLNYAEQALFRRFDDIPF